MPPILSFDPTPELYVPFYEGETVSIGASGKEMIGEKGDALVRSVCELVENRIRVLIAYGGGKQIDDLYETRYGKKRQKINGVAVTDADVLTCAIDVCDQLQRQLMQRLQQALPQGFDVDVIQPEEVVCRYMDFDRRGYVGEPIRIEHDITAPVTLVGFNGFVGKQRANVNKDDIALNTADRMVENFLATETGGVKETFDPAHPEAGKTVPVLFADEIDEQGTHPRYPLSDGMQKKALNAKRMAALSRTVITSGGDIPKEMFSVDGKGTLVVDRSKLVASRPTAKEKRIVEYVIRAYERADKFRPRSQKDLSLALNHHLVLREHTPLAGCSLIPDPDGSMELATLWSGYNGMGKILADRAKDRFLATQTCDILYALGGGSKPDEEEAAIQRFTRYGFRDLGKLSDVNPADMPVHLREYPKTRNPHLFLMTRRELANGK
jgi:acetylglutamate kinase